MRIVKGTAVYTTDFKPSTEPLTNITNTVLLCCNSHTTTGSTVFSETIVGLGMFLREAQKKGFLRKDLSSSLLANLLHGTIGHMMRSEKSRRKLLGVSVHDEDERARIAHHIVALFTGNIKGNGLPVNTESGETIQ